MGGLVVDSNNEALTRPDAMLRQVVAGARLGLVNGQVSYMDEESLIKAFAIKLNEARLFRTVNYPITGDEQVVLEIGADDSVEGPVKVKEFTKGLLCAVTLLLVCLPMSEEYEFMLEVRAIHWPAGPEINRYQATGKSRVTYRITDSENIAFYEARRTAVSAAYNKIINRMIEDRTKYLSGPPTRPLGP
jgi:hypothetical protein